MFHVNPTAHRALPSPVVGSRAGGARAPEGQPVRGAHTDAPSATRLAPPDARRARRDGPRRAKPGVRAPPAAGVRADGIRPARRTALRAPGRPPRWASGRRAQEVVAARPRGDGAPEPSIAAP